MNNKFQILPEKNKVITKIILSNRNFFSINRAQHKMWKIAYGQKYHSPHARLWKLMWWFVNRFCAWWWWCFPYFSFIHVRAYTDRKLKHSHLLLCMTYRLHSIIFTTKLYTVSHKATCTYKQYKSSSDTVPTSRIISRAVSQRTNAHG